MELIDAVIEDEAVNLGSREDFSEVEDQLVFLARASLELFGQPLAESLARPLCASFLSADLAERKDWLSHEEIRRWYLDTSTLAQRRDLKRDMNTYVGLSLDDYPIRSADFAEEPGSH